MSNKVTLLTPAHPHSQEVKLCHFLNFMVNQTAVRFKNNVLLALNKGTVTKFSAYDTALSDKQLGNYAQVVQKLANKVTKQINSQFSQKRLKKIIANILKNADKMHKEITRDIFDDFGLDVGDLLGGINPTVNAQIAIVLKWVIKQRNDTLTNLTNNSLQMMQAGASFRDVMKEVNSQKEFSLKKNKQIARAQMANFNSVLTRVRYGKLGIEEAIWVGANDERERASHKARNGKIFDLKKGLYSKIDGKTLFPAQDYGCRCSYKAVIPKEILQGVDNGKD